MSRKVKIVKEQVTRDITAQDFEKLSLRQTKLIQEYQKVEKEKKQVTEQYAGTLKDNLAEQRLIAGYLDSRQMPKQIDCEIIYDYKEQTVRCIALDDYSTVWNRKMTEQEQQKHLFEVTDEADLSALYDKKDSENVVSFFKQGASSEPAPETPIQPPAPPPDAEPVPEREPGVEGGTEEFEDSIAQAQMKNRPEIIMGKPIEVAKRKSKAKDITV